MRPRKEIPRTEEQKGLWKIRDKVKELRELLKPLSAEEIGAPDPSLYPAPFRLSHIIDELLFVETGIQDAVLDSEHLFNCLVTNPKIWTHPWQKEGSQPPPESMLEKKIAVAFICKNCGADPAILQFPDDLNDDDGIVACKKCAFPFGKFRQIKSEMESYLRRAILTNSAILNFEPSENLAEQ